MTSAVEVPEHVVVDAERFAAILHDGGRVTATVRSRRSGDHVTLVLAAKKVGEDGRMVSRATIEGRVGLADATWLYADTPAREYVGRMEVANGRWRFPREVRESRPADVWTAEHLTMWARGEYDLGAHAEVMLATACSECGQRLTHPESIEDFKGPECASRRRRGRRA